MKRLVVILGMAVAVLSGCAANLITYKPDSNQSVAYNQGVGSITSDGTDASLVMYPTFRYQSGSDLPTFTLMVQDKNGQPLDFDRKRAAEQFLNDAIRRRQPCQRSRRLAIRSRRTSQQPQVGRLLPQPEG